MRPQLKKWKLEPGDTTLLDLLPFLEAVVRTNVPDVRAVRRPPLPAPDTACSVGARPRRLTRRMPKRIHVNIVSAQVVASYEGEEDVTAAFRARMQQLQASQAAQKRSRRGLLGGLSGG